MKNVYNYQEDIERYADDAYHYEKFITLKK